jgi:transposase
MLWKKESEMTKKHNPKPPYPEAFRQQMVELVKAGRKPSELAKEFGCHETSISAWVRKAGGMPTPAQAVPLTGDERRELNELRRKLRQVQQERDILAKATAWFAGKSEKTYTASTSL